MPHHPFSRAAQQYVFEAGMPVSGDHNQIRFQRRSRAGNLLKGYALPDIRFLDHLGNARVLLGQLFELGPSTRHGMVNVVGTTQLLDACTRAGHVPSHVVLTSSRAVYGEGLWRNPDGTTTDPTSTPPPPGGRPP